MAPPHETRRRGRRAALVLAALIAAPLAAELALRALYAPARGFSIWPPFVEVRFRAAPGLMPGIEGEARFLVGSHGLRAGELGRLGEPRVVALGGSTTDCAYLDQTETWTELAAARLASRGTPTWIGNAGHSGHGTREHVLQLPRLLERVSDVDAVLVLAGCNDLALRLGRADAYDARGLAEPELRTAALRRAFSVFPAGADPSLPAWSDLALRRLALDLRARIGGPRRFPWSDGSQYSTWRAHRAGASEWRDELPDLTCALAEYRANLRELGRVAEESGARLVLMTQPALWRADLEPQLVVRLWMGGVGDFQNEPGCAYYTPRALAEALALYADATREVAGELDATLVDLAAEMDGDPALFVDDVHFSEAGARRVAELVARALESEVGGESSDEPLRAGLGPRSE